MRNIVCFFTNYNELQQKNWVSKTKFCYFKNPKVSCSVNIFHVNYGRVISLNHFFPLSRSVRISSPFFMNSKWKKKFSKLIKGLCSTQEFMI